MISYDNALIQYPHVDILLYVYTKCEGCIQIVGSKVVVIVLLLLLNIVLGNKIDNCIWSGYFMGRKIVWNEFRENI